MKKCPYCGAKIEENAKVCLYCMKELQQKEQIAPFSGFIGRRWLIVALVLLLLAGGFFLLHKMNNNPVPQPQEEQTEQATDPVGLESGEKEPEHPKAEKNDPTADTSSQKQENGNTAQKENPTSDPQGSDQKGSNPPGKQESPDKEGGDKKEDSTTKEESTEEGDTGGESGSEETGGTDDEKSDPEPEPDPAPAPTAAVYTWRDAEYAKDDYLVTANVDNCVVITGVSTPASDGIYRIPETLGGKRVIAIKQSAFNGEGVRDTVRAVYLPSSVRTVQANAFSACYNLTDIYFSAKSIYVDPWAFAAKDRRSNTLTIHCAYDCNNRDLRYYRNIAESYYDAQFKEWNG